MPVLTTYFDKKVLPHHKNIASPLLEPLQFGAIFQAWLTPKQPNLSQGQKLHSGVVRNAFFNGFKEKMCSEPTYLCFVLFLAT